MKRNISIYGIVLAFLLLTCSTAFSTVWRVNPLDGAGADFTSINDAVASTSVLNGDTLYLEGSGSSLSTGSVSITKTLTIIGPGYFLDEYTDTQANIAPARISNAVTIGSGAEGTLIKGVYINNTLNISTSDVTVKRCYFPYLKGIVVGYGSAADNAIIMQNYGWNVTVKNSSEDVIIANNILVANYGGISVESGSTAGISNNVIYNSGYGSAMSLYGSTVTNNIVRDGAVSSTNCSFYNNIGNEEQFGTENGNQSNVVMNSSVFLLSGATDEKYQLAVESPAIGAGVDGVDCGAFGGDTPYVLAGVPDYPTIYYFTSPLTSAQDSGLQVTIKTKVNN